MQGKLSNNTQPTECNTELQRAIIQNKDKQQYRDRKIDNTEPIKNLNTRPTKCNTET